MSPCHGDPHEPVAIFAAFSQRIRIGLQEVATARRVRIRAGWVDALELFDPCRVPAQPAPARPEARRAAPGTCSRTRKSRSTELAPAYRSTLGAARRCWTTYNSRYADLLFEVVTRRYDAGKPVLLSTNKVIDIEADSYRLKEAKELTAARTKRRSKKQPPS